MDAPFIFFFFTSSMLLFQNSKWSTIEDMKSKFFVIVSAVLLLILATCVITITQYTSRNENGKHLIFLQIITRHGDRAPVFKYPNDPNAGYVWPEGMGKLTNLGKKQQFMLGKHIRSMYRDFITSNPNEVNAASSESARCIISAQAHLAGLYEPNPQWVFHESLKWQPIAVKYAPEKDDKVLSLAYDCPLARNEIKKSVLLATEENAIKYKEMFEHLTVSSGMNVMGTTIYKSNVFPNILLLFDTLLIQKSHNLVVPDWAKFYWKYLVEVFDKAFFALVNSPIFQRLRSGPFIEKMTNMMSHKMNGDLSQLKVQLYSTHDSIMASLLIALGLYNGRRPPYSSTLLVELHKDLNQEHFVRFLYLNSSTPELGEQESHVLKLDGCSEFCPFDYFKNLTAKFISVDVAEECKVNK